MAADKNIEPSILDRNNKDIDWLPISDLMTGLMVIFLFISISYMIAVQAQKKQIVDIAQSYITLQQQLYVDLLQEFKEDLPRWSARIDSSSLSVTFTEPDVLFAAGSAQIRPRFEEILRDFFPRYVRILTSPMYEADISEVRIEGHTSSEWEELPPDEAYFYNMNLSQGRTRSVLQFVMKLVEGDSIMVAWLKDRFTANGLSSSKLILNEKGLEDRQRSRRVEFRVKTRADERLQKILQLRSLE
ncbi:MAG: OmpA family protein [bacterium]|jgi:outer membrane protein OmpA-like peptidoglycan-associated protein